MAIYPLRKLPELPCSGIETQWLEKLGADLASGTDRATLCRRTLCEIAYPEFANNWETAVVDTKLPVATRLALSALDPRNVTLEPEYYAECDDARFQKVKPLLWLWYSSIAPCPAVKTWSSASSSAASGALHLQAVRRELQSFQYVEFSFGYNMEVGDNVVVHRYVLLDDRGGISLGNNVSISDYANIYSHTHSIVDQRDVTDAPTRLDDGVRITYHATVLAGVHVGEQAMVGAMAVATKDVRPYHVYVGIPAKSVRVKPNAPAGPENLTTVKRR